MNLSLLVHVNVRVFHCYSRNKLVRSVYMWLRVHLLDSSLGSAVYFAMGTMLCRRHCTKISTI